MNSRNRDVRIVILMFALLVSAAFAAPVSAQDACQAQAANQQQLVDAINNAHTNCAAGATITLTAAIETTSGTVTDSYNQGVSAFPVIMSTIVIEGNGHSIVRNSNSGNYRFFSVGANGNLTLKNLTMTDGGIVNKGGAILVRGDGGDATLLLSNVTLRNNTSSNDGGAIQIASVNNSATTVTIEDSVLSGNSGGPGNTAEGEGGAIYSDGRGGGTLQLSLKNTDVSNNIAGRDAGALRFLTSGSATVSLNVENSNFMNNTQPQCVFQGQVAIGGTNQATDSSCGQSTILATCSLFAANADALSAAINDANDEVKCPGPDIIRLTADVQTTAGYQDGQSAFPAVTSTITIDGANTGTEPAHFMITRDASAPAFRFFHVDGTNGSKGVLTLQNLTLTGGGDTSLPGGAVFVDAHDNGNASLSADNVQFNGNHGDNGGAIMLLTPNGGKANAVIENSAFDGNSGIYGGAVYTGAFDGGSTSVLILNTTFTNNTASASGGAVYNNAQGNGIATMTVENSTFTTNSAPDGGAIINDGHRAGNGTLIIRASTFTGNSATAGVDSIASFGNEDGSAMVTLPDAAVVGGANENVCISDDSGTLEVVACQ